MCSSIYGKPLRFPVAYRECYKITKGYTGDNLTRRDASYDNTYRLGLNARKR